MPTYTAPVRDTRFILNNVLDIGRYSNLPGFANATPDLIEAILEEAGKFCRRGAAAAEPHRRRSRVQAQRRWLGHHAARLQGSLRAVLRGRLADADRRRRNMAGRACRRSSARRSANISFPPTTASKCTRG